MRILIVDPLSYIGHVNYNYGIIRGIARFTDYSILVNEKMRNELIYKGVDEEKFLPSYSEEWNITFLAKKYKSKFIYHFLFRKYFLDVMKMARKTRKEYDGIIVTSIDILSFAPVSYLYSDNYIVVDHGIGSIKTNTLYRLAWKLCNHKIKLVVLENFIADMVKSFDKNRKVFVVRHPIPDKMKEKKDSNRTSGSSIKIFAPGASNNADFIEKLKLCEISDEILLTIKGKEEYVRDGLHIYNRYITNEEYSNYLSEANYVLLAYENDYDYRTSAVLFEAARQNIPVIILNNNTLRNYKHIFKDNVYLVASAEQMLKIAHIHKNDVHASYDLSDYEDEEIGKSIIAAFEG